MAAKIDVIDAAQALPGRPDKMPFVNRHFVTGNAIFAIAPEKHQWAIFGLGCFWGAERLFWGLPGVYSTSVGYAGGHTPNPHYDEVCSGQTGHNEVVQVVFDADVISYSELLRFFWKSHNPTEGMRQGNDSGTQYRSGIYFTSAEQQLLAEQSRAHYQSQLTAACMPSITTEIITLDIFYFAEDYHQQYLAKNPEGYCGIGGTGVSY